VAVIHLLDVLLCAVVSALLLVEVHALGLDQTVNLGTYEADEGLLGELVGNRLACG
jgi:hypothetical protein